MTDTFNWRRRTVERPRPGGRVPMVFRGPAFAVPPSVVAGLLWSCAAGWRAAGRVSRRADTAHRTDGTPAGVPQARPRTGDPYHCRSVF
ncbi:hypothetical protein GCM10010259_67630 [Streptomyces daghestanicus]|uniref:Uncharacterized protein n=1 Tax=Streptomyces daghestanicus TaxID=66885 RepID=A0ABQ3Q7U3_9ACTN|nr:hypothetical protein GCM10010259_67630 [Streptomyces daghestanicus]GHI33344.1 hypothetical protein Sdagh_50740 [Streptomyces daghestanicus]